MASQAMPVTEMNKGAGAGNSSVTENTPAKNPSSKPPHCYCSFEDMDEFKSTYKMVQERRIKIDRERSIVESNNLAGEGHVTEADVQIEEKMG